MKNDLVGIRNRVLRRPEQASVHAAAQQRLVAKTTCHHGLSLHGATLSRGSSALSTFLNNAEEHRKALANFFGCSIEAENEPFVFLLYCYIYELQFDRGLFHKTRTQWLKSFNNSNNFVFTRLSETAMIEWRPT